MHDLDGLIAKLTEHISKQAIKQSEKPTTGRLEFMNALALARNDLLDLKRKHERVLNCIL